jgi:ArsR family transcriptional regulator
MAAATQSVELSEDQLLLVAKALADPRRYEILKRIGGYPDGTSCAAVRECIDISPATLSHHMKELEAAGLVRSTRDGKFMHYKILTPVLRAYAARLKSDLG